MAPEELGRADPVVQLLEAAPSSILGVDGHGRVTFANSRFLSLLGYENDDVIGTDASLFLAPRWRARHASLVADFLAHPAPVPMDPGGRPIWAVTKDGDELPVDLSLTPAPWGDATAVVVSVLDASQRVAAERRAESQTRYFTTLAEINRAIIRAADEEHLFTGVCQVAVEVGGYLGTWIGQADAQGRVLPVAVAGDIEQMVSQLQVTVDPDVPWGQGVTALALRDGKVSWIPDIATDPSVVPWRGLAATYGIRSAATMPLLLHGSPVAVMSLYSRDPHVLDTGMRDLLEQVVGNVSFALAGLAARDDLKALAKQRADLMQRLVLAEENERARVANDLHDESVQTLAAVALRLGVLKSRVSAAAPDLLPAVQLLEDTVGSATGSLRELLFDLEPGQAQASLESLVSDAASHIFGSGGGANPRWTVAAHGDLMLSDAVKVQALRILKEAMSNARRHAQADLVTITISGNADQVVLRVSDDGIGLADNADVVPGHRGQISMRDRAESLGGWCRFENAPTGGTVVTASLPSGA